MSLFENNETTVAKFEDLVGEGKKYKDQDAAVKAIIEKDSFIERLKSEQEQLRQELAARPAVDRSQEILDRLEALNRKEPVTERIQTTDTERTEVKGLSIDDVERVLVERERRARAESNINSVKAKLQEQFGDKYGPALKSMAEKNGLSEKALNDLAAQSPQLVLNLMGTVKPEGLFTPPSSSGSGDFTPSASGAQPLSYYLKLKATDKNAYFSKPVQNQMYKDGMVLKEAFNDVPN